MIGFELMDAFESEPLTDNDARSHELPEQQVDVTSRRESDNEPGYDGNHINAN